MSLKRFMQHVSSKKAPGPSTTFTIFHVYYALELIAQKPLGRNKLAELLHVGDGAVRTIISRLTDAKLIEISKTGCNLTQKGKDIWRQLEEFFPKQADLPKSEFSNFEFNHAFLVKNSAQNVTSGIDQRDAAIIAGARRAFVMIFKDGHLRIESVSDNVEKQYPKAAKKVLEIMKPEENDVIVLASAETKLKAKRGAFAASWSLIKA